MGRNLPFIILFIGRYERRLLLKAELQELGVEFCSLKDRYTPEAVVELEWGSGTATNQTGHSPVQTPTLLYRVLTILNSVE